MTAGYKYFRFEDIEEISVKVRGSARGKLVISTEPKGTPVGAIVLEPAKEWKSFSGKVSMEPGVRALFFRFEGKGKLDFLEFYAGVAASLLLGIFHAPVLPELCHDLHHVPGVG